MSTDNDYRNVEQLPEITDRAMEAALETARDVYKLRNLAEFFANVPEGHITPEERAAAEAALAKIEAFLEETDPHSERHESTQRPAVPEELLPDGPVTIGTLEEREE